MSVDRIPGQVTMWWDAEENCLMMQVGDRPPIPVDPGSERTLRFRGPDNRVQGSIKFRVQRRDNSNGRSTV